LSCCQVTAEGPPRRKPQSARRTGRATGVVLWHTVATGDQREMARDAAVAGALSACAKEARAAARMPRRAAAHCWLGARPGRHRGRHQGRSVDAFPLNPLVVVPDRSWAIPNSTGDYGPRQFEARRRSGEPWHLMPVGVSSGYASEVYRCPAPCRCRTRWAAGGPEA
jgi:hypothetical protein